MKQSVVYIGVDVAKRHLDVAWQEQSRRFPNDKSGRAALVAWIKQSPTAVQLLCEASGGYEQALLESLEQSELKVTLVQPIGCGSMRARLASWPRRTRSMPMCSRPLAQRCGLARPRHTRPRKSACANTKHSVGT